ncbi:MAG: UDP-glucose/GDP-mannose dehydrogenase family protein [Gammaproteobacteria bacterium]|nr:UDP-glucose/GDP-mannose dehydrogenase family protein [Gammaproteobacteria bacterium]
MRISVFGSGYVGLVTGACLAEVGNDVLCVDIDPEKIKGLQAGRIPIHEHGLETLVARNAAAGRLRFSTDAAGAVSHGEALVIAVGTPPGEDGSADLSHMLAVAREIGRHLSSYRVIIDKSTVPVGTADRVAGEISKSLAERGVSCEFDVVSNPEFLKEGAAVADFMKPDRVVVGSDSPRAIALLRALYAPFTRNHERLIVMDPRSAELTKYAANAMLATRISFMNELAGIAERVGADIEKVRQGIGSDSRIGFSFIYPGAGYGGSCFPKDVKALTRTAIDAGADPKLLQSVEAVNDGQKDVLFKKFSDFFGSKVSGMTVALWGLAFKPNTDDMREAPSRRFLEAAWASGVSVRAYDPVAMREAEKLYPKHCASSELVLCKSPMEAIEGAEALVVVTEWQEFRSPDFEALRTRLKQPVIFDGRNLYDPERLKSLGFRYFAIGRGETLI